MAKQIWEGASGQIYEYEIQSFDAKWSDVPGNYIFAKQVSNSWQSVYIGETESLKDRITTSHEKYPCTVAKGFTHVHAHGSSSNQATRRQEETDLLNRFNPPCNKE